jgi:hypothetical protein
MGTQRFSSLLETDDCTFSQMKPDMLAAMFPNHFSLKYRKKNRALCAAGTNSAFFRTISVAKVSQIGKSAKSKLVILAP